MGLAVAFRNLCVNNGYFTCGSNRQYDKFFKVVDGKNVHDITLCIWMCSDDSADIKVIEKQVENILKVNS